jgi:Protein of unknown function (DUF3320)
LRNNRTDTIHDSYVIRTKSRRTTDYRTAGRPRSELANEVSICTIRDRCAWHRTASGKCRNLSSWLAKVVAVESPVFWMEAARRIANAAGVERLGIRIQDAFRHACRVGHNRGRFVARGEFLWRSDMTIPPVRDRSDFPQSAKKIEYVAPEEIHSAIEQVVRESYGIDRDDVATSVGRLLGFLRITDEMRSTIDRELDVVIAAGRLVLKNGSVHKSSAL